jgi:hypothetical protein
LTGPDQDWTGPDQDWTGPDQDWTGPDQDLTGPDRDLTGPDQDWTGPDLDLTGPDLDLTGPDQDWTGPDQDWTGPDQDWTGCVSPPPNPENSFETSILTVADTPQNSNFDRGGIFAHFESISPRYFLNFSQIRIRKVLITLVRAAKNIPTALPNRDEPTVPIRPKVLLPESF